MSTGVLYSSTSLGSVGSLYTERLASFMRSRSSYDMYLYILYSKSCCTSSALGSSSSPSSFTSFGSSMRHLISRSVAAMTMNSLMMSRSSRSI